MDNQLKPDTKKVIDELNTGKFKSIIATGDNIFTAISVANKAKILQENEKVIYSHSLEHDSNYEQYIKWEYDELNDQRA